MSKLADILQQEVLAEIDAILAEADSQAGRLIDEAKQKASARMAARRKRAESEARRSVQRTQSAAEFTVATARMQAKDRMIEQVRNKALAAIEETAGKPSYAQILQALAEEALKAVETAEAVIVNPRDQENLRDWAKAKGLELRVDPGLRLGVRMETRGGKRSVLNSLPERFQRSWDLLTSGVAKILWE
jgi:V/A-type H+-transporting ATPase subunit E